MMHNREPSDYNRDILRRVAMRFAEPAKAHQRLLFGARTQLWEGTSQDALGEWLEAQRPTATMAES
jgi:hypothetical protein